MLTVCIPVCNEGRHLKETMESLLKNIEDIKTIVICDNCSEDDTQEICLAYAKQHDKIRYIRQENRLSAFDNWCVGLEYATTRYFMWLAGHDLISQGYIQSMKRLLDQDQSAVVAVPSVYYFCDDLSQSKLTTDFSTNAFSSSLQRERVAAVFQTQYSWLCINQVWRREQLLDITENIKRKKERWASWDVIFAMHAALLGKYMVDPHSAYYYRHNRPSETSQQVKERYEQTFKIKIPMINSAYYIPQEFCQLLYEYAPELASDKSLICEMLWYCRRYFDADLSSYLWRIRHGKVEAKNEMVDTKKIKTLLGKKCVIFGAMKEGKIFYQLVNNCIDVQYFVDNFVNRERIKLYRDYLVYLIKRYVLRWEYNKDFPEAMSSSKNNLVVHSPSYLQGKSEGIVVILGSSLRTLEMKEQMEKIGFTYGTNMYYYGDFIIEDKEE